MVPQQPSLGSRKYLLTFGRSRAKWILLAGLAVVGSIVAWGRGQLPEREHQAPTAGVSGAGESEGPGGGNAQKTAPDLQLYREVVAEVRAGGDYYNVARQRIPSFGFPIHSPLNWRLPTYAWLFARLPGPLSIQAALVLLSIAALAMAFIAEKRRSGPFGAAFLVLLLFGVVRWSLDGEAFYTQEVWAATLILISLSAYMLNRPTAAIITGCAALMLRELALPYCVAGMTVAVVGRRWKESAGWALGIGLFFCFYAWHIGQVRAQLADIGTAGGTDMGQWLRLGGLDFVLLTERMNGLFFAAPALVLWLYLLGSLMGLASRSDTGSRVACLAAVLYLLAFAVVGRPENFYWGLMYAPLLPWGIVAILNRIVSRDHGRDSNEFSNVAPSGLSSLLVR